MRILVLASTLAVAAAWLASPAFAQNLPPGMGLPLNSDAKTLTPEEKEAQEARDKAYKESLKKIPNQTAPNDPWGSARAAEQQQKAAPAKPRPASTAAPAQKKNNVTAN
ncbi:MAG: hypothetical protein ACOY4O_17095 [Pseudomonadota bacterium]